FNFEEFRENALVNSIPAGNPTVPTDAYRAGNFNQVIIGNGNNGVANPFNITASCVKGDPSPLCANGKTTFTQAYIDPLGNTYPSGTIYDPQNFQTVTCTSNGFVGQPNCNSGSQYVVRMPYAQANQIPVSAFDPVSVRILNLVPKPTGPNFTAGIT